MTDCPNCEYHRKRAQLWREEAYKQAGHPLPECGEPVAWRAKNFYQNQEGWFYAEWHPDGLTPQVAELLYTTPPQRTWVGLTDEEIEVLAKKHNGIFYDCDIEFAHAIEAKLKEENNG
jgi:hypothetical protein